MTKYIVYLEGNISAGKSTLIPLLSNKLKTLLCNTKIYEYPEPLHIWNEIKHNDTPLLKILYEFPQYADRFQYLALITRQAQYMNFLEKPGECLAIVERSYMSDKLFQTVLFNNGHINKLDMDIYNTAHIPQIKHIHVYIRTRPDICFDRIHNKRKRPEETTINAVYLNKLHIQHELMFMKDHIICVDNDNQLTDENINVLCNYIIQMIKCS